MALQLNVNSYVTLDQANNYIDNQLNNEVWYTSNFQEQALVTATGILDQLNWDGARNSGTTSGLAWPRNITILDSKFGRSVQYVESRTSSTPTTAVVGIPPEIRDATCELALHLLRNGSTILGNEGGSNAVRGLSVGTIRLDFDTSNRADTEKGYTDLPQIVYNLIRRYLDTSSNRTVRVGG